MLFAAFSTSVVCLAFGAALLNGLLCCAAYLVELKGTEMSQHFFAVERGPAEKLWIDRAMDRFTFLMLWVILGLLGCLVLCGVYIQIVQCLPRKQLSNAVDYLQNSADTLFPILISVTVFLFGIRKNYQTFFVKDDRLHRYQGFLILAIVCWGLSVILGLVAATGAAPTFRTYVATLRLLLLLGTFLFSLFLAWTSIRLSFSAQPIDLAQFKTLGLHRHDTPWELWSCHYPDTQALDFSQKHLILDLQQQTTRFEKTLQRRCKLHKARDLQVSFSDAAHMSPVWYKRLCLWVWLPLTWLMLGFPLCGVLSAFKINVFSMPSCDVLLPLVSSVLFLCLAFFLRTESCRRIAVYNTYGSWGYYFTAPSTSKTVYSFSEREFSLSQSKAWLRAVWRILTLFRMELVQEDRAAYSGFLRDLATAADMTEGLRRDMMMVTYCLCCRLGQAECPQDRDAFQAPTLFGFSAQLCNAIWTDHTRCAPSLVETDPWI